MKNGYGLVNVANGEGVLDLQSERLGGVYIVLYKKQEFPLEAHHAFNQDSYIFTIKINGQMFDHFEPLTDRPFDSIEKLHALIVKIHEFISSKIDNIVTRATDYSDGYDMFDAAAAEPTTVSPHRDLVTPTLPF